MNIRKTIILVSGVATLALPAVARAADAEAGKAMFDMVCKYCHKSDYDDKYGPGLKGVLERVDEAWLDNWLKDPAAMVKSDEHAKDLRQSNDFDMTMPAIPAMKDPYARANMIEYLKTLK
ncbi:MAG: cytochrome c [Mariprofundaceae bacterium]